MGCVVFLQHVSTTKKALMNMQPTPTAVFDAKLLLWTDGKTKKDKPTGIWNYYNLGGERILQRTFNQQGKVCEEQYFPPKGVDKKAILHSPSSTINWFVEAPEDKDGLKNGLHKAYFRVDKNTGEPIAIRSAKKKSLEQLLNIWENSAYFLIREMCYENGFLAWLKLYDVEGNIVDFQDYNDDKGGDDKDEADILIEKMQQRISIKNKSFIKNYQEYLEMLVIYDESKKDNLKIHNKATKKDLETAEKRLGCALPAELKAFYSTYANGVDVGMYYLNILPTDKIVGVIEHFKYLRDNIACLPKHALTEAVDNDYLEYLNNNYFVFAGKFQDADVFMLLVNKEGNYFAIDYGDDYSNNIEKKYLQNLDNSPHSNNLTLVMNNFLRIEKTMAFNRFMEDVELYDACIECEAQDIDKLFKER